MRIFSPLVICALCTTVPLASVTAEAARAPHAPYAGVMVEDDEVLDLSLQKLADIEYEPGDDIDKEILAYNGRTIRITGYMRTGTTEGETWFDLTNDSCGCGTGKLQHFVRVTLEDDTTRFQPGELSLEGTFAVGEKEDEDGFVESIYRLTIQRLDD
jgi:hypothetical protein